MIPTIIEYLILLVVIAVILFFAFPVGLYLLSFVPFLGIVVHSFGSCVIFTLVLTGFGVICLGLEYLNARFAPFKVFYYLFGILLVLAQVSAADYFVHSVALPLYLKIIYSIIGGIWASSKFRSVFDYQNLLRKKSNG